MIHEKISHLVYILNEYTKSYDEGKPVISDKEWDNIYFELQKLEKESGIYLPDSPTQKINYQVVNELNKIKHNHPMLSLDKTKNWDEFIRYFNSKSVVGMLKLDGLTCSLKYENGKLISAETRGDGEIGEDILHNALVVKNIPNKIDYLDDLILDGEIICTKQDFEPFKNDYANQRNFAAGSIRLLDAEECSKRNLKFIVWNIINSPKDNVIDSFEFIDELGFTVVPWVSSWDMDAKDFLVNQAKELGYPIDGLVGRFDDIEYGESLGSTDHHSKAAYAFKFPDETCWTNLLDIEYTMGRTGALTPVAIFEPIELEGSIIERASLHNLSVMEDLLGIPYYRQKIEVFKANMIIPQILSAEKECKGGYIFKDNAYLMVYPSTFTIPMVCPICGGLTGIHESVSGTKELLCMNPNCEGKLINRLDHFCGKKGLDIKGFSKATIEKLINWGWLSNFTDIFELKKYRNDWIQKPGFGVKSVDKILDAIESSRKCELDAFIAALGIPLVGATAAKDLAKEFLTWEKFIEAVNDPNYYFWNLPNFGSEMHSSIKNFNYDEANELNTFIINIKQTKIDKKLDNLNGLVFVITGKLSNYKNRDELKSVIESQGGKVSGSISSKTNYLINNDINSNSSKNLNAKKLNIEIITEIDFIEKFLQN